MSERFTFKIDKKNELKIWDTQLLLPDNAPIIIQPSWPNGDAWSKEEAELWATTWIDAALDPESQFIPGFSAVNPVVTRPSNEVLEAEIVIESPAAITSPESGTSEITAETAE